MINMKIWALSLGIMGLSIYCLVRRYDLLVGQQKLLDAKERFYGRVIRNWGSLPIFGLIYWYWSAPEDLEAKIGIPFAMVSGLFFVAVTVLVAEIVVTDRTMRSGRPGP